MPLVGDTVRLKSEFKDYNGELVDPDDVKIIIYDSRYKKIEEFTPSRSEKGRYCLDYTIPSGETNIMYFEFQGKIDDKPVLGRMGFKRKWAQ